MPQYRVYRDQSVEIEKRFRKESRLFRGLAEPEVRQQVVLACLQADEVCRQTALLERVHSRTGSRLYFIEDAELVDFLETSDFKVDPSSLAFPARVISVAVPADVSDLNGFLLSRQEPVQFDKDVQELFAFARIYQNVRVNCHPEPMVAFAMVSPKEKNARLHFGVPFDEVTDTLTGTWFKQHLVSTSAKMSDSDAQFQARHLNLGLRLLAYMSAFPEMVRPGLPEGVVQKKDRQPGRSKALTIGLHPRLRTSPSAHLRRGHFRSLSHDRFHRDLDGNVRIIYVNPMIVGHSVTPFTVEHKDA